MSAPDVEKGDLPGNLPTNTTKEDADRSPGRFSESTIISDGSVGSKKRFQVTASSFSAHMSEEVSSKYADFLMLACYFCSGLTDSTVFNAYGTFVSMQTGNTIFVGLGASHQDVKPFGWLESLMSIVFYSIGCFCFARASLVFGARKRGVLITSFFIQSALVFIAAGLIQGHAINGAVPQQDTINMDWAQIAPIILLSFQAAGQICAGRNLGISELPTIVITSLLYDLWSDPKLTDGLTKNAKRNRRACGFTLELLGAIAGGWMSKRTHGLQSVLFLVASIKAVIFLSWTVWAKKT